MRYTPQSFIHFRERVLKVSFALAFVMFSMICSGCATHSGEKKSPTSKDADCCEEAPVGTTLPAK
jgi:hypothetical protein